MQSFVVQNFITTHIISERTRRNIPTVLFNYKSIALTTLINTLCVGNLSNTHFKSLNLFYILTSTYSRFSGNMSNNITKSLYFLLFNYIIRYVSKSYKSSFPYTKPFIYKKVIKIALLPIYKTKLNLLLYYTSKIFSTSNYISILNYFVVKSNYIILNSNFNFYMFINLFYFKVRHY